MADIVDWSDIDLYFNKTQSGSIDIVYGEDVINQSIKIILSTIQGERVRSEFGSSVFRLLFNPMSEDSAEELRNVIRTAIQKYENRAIFENVVVRPDYDNNSYQLQVSYKILPSMKKKNFNTNIRSMGEM